MQFFLDNNNLSPFLACPPTIQWTLVSDFKIPADEEKVVAFESLIMVNFFDSKMISCLYFNPLNFFKVLIKISFLSLNILTTSKMNCKFSLFPSVLKYGLLIFLEKIDLYSFQFLLFLVKSFLILILYQYKNFWHLRWLNLF